MIWCQSPSLSVADHLAGVSKMIAILDDQVFRVCVHRRQR